MRLANKPCPATAACVPGERCGIAAAVVQTLQGRLTVAPANGDTCATAPCALQDALLFTLEGGKAVGDVPFKALPHSQQLVVRKAGEERLGYGASACAGAKQQAAHAWPLLCTE